MRRLLGVLREDAGGETGPTARRSRACEQLNELVDEARDVAGGEHPADRARRGRRRSTRAWS